jgi:peptidoglycan/xylan/chitin deacetylase (PgdA/CDA1 family)
VPEYVDPRRRPPLVEELDRLLPETLDLFESLELRATFFVLGEVAERLPARVRALAERGHEVACHGHLHLRSDDRSPAGFRADLVRARDRLEQTVGRPVVGYRAPEWSLRTPANPRLRGVAELGFRYDSSLMAAAGAGRAGNPRHPAFVRWPDGVSILELPPLVLDGPVSLPASGWCGRCASPRRLRRAVERSAFALLVVHPWELVERPVPGLYTGLARFLHDAGRSGYRERFVDLVRGLRPRPLAELLTDAEATPSAAPAPAAGGVRVGAELSLDPSTAGAG